MKYLCDDKSFIMKHSGRFTIMTTFLHIFRQKVGDELKRQGKDKAYEWMLERTKPIYPKSPRSGRSNAGNTQSSAFILISICLIMLKFIIEI